MDFASPQRFKRVRNRTALFRCVFGSADGPLKDRRSNLRIHSLVLIT